LVVPTLVATTTVPEGKVPVTPPVVTEIGVPVVWVPGKPVVVTEALTFSWPLTSVWSQQGCRLVQVTEPVLYAPAMPVIPGVVTG